MSATASPFGFVVNRHPSGQARAEVFTIAAAYATAISKGQPVILVTGGGIEAAAVNQDLLGIFHGVEYTDSVGRRIKRTDWPAGGVTGATDIQAYVYTDPDIEYLVQASGPVAATAIGDQADVINPTAASRGRSTCGLDATLKGATLQGQFRITGFGLQVDNAPGDAYTNVHVKIARHVFAAAKVAI